jgi:hypothetical protein
VKPIKQHKYRRFRPLAAHRAHHRAVTSFTVLSITGMPQMFSPTLGDWAIDGDGRDRDGAHHPPHLGHVLMLGDDLSLRAIDLQALCARVRHDHAAGLQDVKDALQAFSYNVGWSRSRRAWGAMQLWREGRVLGGDLGHGGHGAHRLHALEPDCHHALSCPASSSRRPRRRTAARRCLAVLSIITWHFYNVHVKRFNKSMFTGYISRTKWKEEHAPS